jgi:AhpD family alkylhydroperoxidase
MKETGMKPRLNYFAAAPETMQAMLDLENRVRESGLEHSLIHLVKTRASQVNGCAFCIHMHTRDARAQGETEERLYLLDAWRESPLYTDRERAALAWTEALTLVSQTHAPDQDYEALREHFSEEEQVKLTLLIATINAWNRLSIGFRSVHPVEARRKAGADA